MQPGGIHARKGKPCRLPDVEGGNARKRRLLLIGDENDALDVVLDGGIHVRHARFDLQPCLHDAGGFAQPLVWSARPAIYLGRDGGQHRGSGRHLDHRDPGPGPLRHRVELIADSQGDLVRLHGAGVLASQIDANIGDVRSRRR